MQRIEEILGRHALHVGGSVGAEALGSGRVALAAALDLVQDNAGDDDKEHAAQGTAEGDQDDDAVGVVSS
jgi:hypothetical protein